MNDAEAVVLAAGKGTRMNSERPKVLHECFGEPMIQHILRSLSRSEVSSTTVVLGSGKEQVETVLPSSVQGVEQQNQLGTGDAVRVALEQKQLSPQTPVIVTCGDIPGIRPNTFDRLLRRYREGSDELVLLIANVTDSSGYGRIILNEADHVERIVEEVDATDQEKAIQTINTGIMCGSANAFGEYIHDLDNDNEAGEFYLTDIVDQINNDGGSVGSLRVEDEWEITGINTRSQLVEFEREYYDTRTRQLLEKNVTVHTPRLTQIGPWVDVKPDVDFNGHITLFGETVIGSNTSINGRTRIQDSLIGNSNVIHDSTIKNAKTGKNVEIGPYSHIRPGTTLKDNVRLGNFVEVKQSTLGDDTNAAHLSYIGDSEIGMEVNVGAGTITCNYDGFKKHKTVIEDETFIGSNVELVAPVTLGKGCMIGAGSTITRDVPPYSLGVSRADQENRENWVRDVWLPRKNRDDT